MKKTYFGLLLTISLWSFHFIFGFIHHHHRDKRGFLNSNLTQRWWHQIADVAGNEIVLHTPTKTLNRSKQDASDCNLSSPREWLEYCESMTTATSSAYTVLRCDYCAQKRDFSIWGKEFHWQRLVDSCQSMVKDTSFEMSKDLSEKILLILLDDAKKSFQELTQSSSLPTSNEENFFTVMVTILWEPSITGIQVKGHAFSNLELTRVSISNSILAAIALGGERENLPNRFENFPQRKLSNWCRRRRPLEQMFKTNGVGEVLLSKREKSSVLLLEGLTSNIFVLYPGNILRTPPTDCVLSGYARQLVLQSAERCGLDVEVAPISISDAHEWKEVFLTSSIRLVVPVQEILLPAESQSSSEKKYGIVLWKDPGDTRISKKIFHEILKHKGYN